MRIVLGSLDTGARKLALPSSSSTSRSCGVRLHATRLWPAGLASPSVCAEVRWGHFDIHRYLHNKNGCSSCEIKTNLTKVAGREIRNLIYLVVYKGLAGRLHLTQHAAVFATTTAWVASSHLAERHRETKRGGGRDEIAADVNCALYYSVVGKNLLLCFTIIIAGCCAFQFGLGRVESPGRVAC